jgi:hypothetical protein
MALLDYFLGFLKDDFVIRSCEPVVWVFHWVRLLNQSIGRVNELVSHSSPHFNATRRHDKKTNSQVLFGVRIHLLSLINLYNSIRKSSDFLVTKRINDNYFEVIMLSHLNMSPWSGSYLVSEPSRYF